MTFLSAAKAILEEMKVPMHFKKITELAIQKRYISSNGKTPEWTMGARLSVDVKENGPKSEFMRIDSGRYGLRRWKRGKIALPDTSTLETGPRYWLVSVEPENFEADEKSNRLDTIGLKHRMRRTLAKLRPGDQVAIYLKRVAAFSAILEITGKAYEDASQRWPLNGSELSARIRCKPKLVLPKVKNLDARPLYGRLQVFTQYPAKHRTLALRNGITEISKEDFEIIENSMRQRQR